MTGQVSVIVVDLRNVVVVPTAAVGGTGGQPTVQVLENGSTRVLPVVVGLSTSSGVQILAGLQAGQTVVTGVVGSDAAASPQANQGRGGGLFGGGAAPGGAFFGGGGGGGAGGGGAGEGASGRGAGGGGTGRGTTGNAGSQGSGGP
jgi:hypothetical protein